MDALIGSTTTIPLTEKIILNRDEVLDLMDQMRAAIPEDIQHAQEVLAARDELLKEAREAARRLQEEAETLFNQRLDAHALVVAARDEANEITSRGHQQAQAHLHKTEAEVAASRRELDEYSLELLRRLEANLSGQLASVRSGMEAILEKHNHSPGSDPGGTTGGT